MRDRTKHFALRIVEMFSVIPKTMEAQVLGKQMLPSGTLVGANYREAYRGRSKAEFMLVEGKIVPSEKLLGLRQECDELSAIFVTILKRSKETS